jgi:hypothetical protein
MKDFACFFLLGILLALYSFLGGCLQPHRLLQLYEWLSDINLLFSSWATLPPFHITWCMDTHMYPPPFFWCSKILMYPKYLSLNKWSLYNISFPHQIAHCALFSNQAPTIQGRGCEGGFTWSFKLYPKYLSLKWSLYDIWFPHQVAHCALFSIQEPNIHVLVVKEGLHGVSNRFTLHLSLYTRMRLPTYFLIFHIYIILRYLHKNTKMNKTVKKKVNFINASQNEGLSPLCIALSFDGFGSISWHRIWFFRLLYRFHNFSFFFPSDFHLFRP